VERPTSRLYMLSPLPAIRWASRRVTPPPPAAVGALTCLLPSGALVLRFVSGGTVRDLSRVAGPPVKMRVSTAVRQGGSSGVPAHFLRGGIGVEAPHPGGDRAGPGGPGDGKAQFDTGFSEGVRIVLLFFFPIARGDKLALLPTIGSGVYLWEPAPLRQDHSGTGVGYVCHCMTRPELHFRKLYQASTRALSY